MLQVVTLRARPDLRAQVFGAPFRAAWPAFMQHDPVADLYFEEPEFSACLDTAFAVVEEERPDVVVGRAFAVPFAFGGPGREALPDTGWDGVIRWAHRDRVLGRAPNAVSALEITLLPEHRGRGESAVVLRAVVAQVRALGFRELFVPLRPTGKHLAPLEPMAAYAGRVRADGLPVDPWLRVHVRAGAVVVKVAPVSMVVAGTVAQWSAWAGMAFEVSGAHVVPGALAPVHVSLEQDYAVYVEANVWVRHSLFG